MLNVVMPRLYTEYCYAERGLCRYAECRSYQYRSGAEAEHFQYTMTNDLAYCGAAGNTLVPFFIRSTPKERDSAARL